MDDFLIKMYKCKMKKTDQPGRLPCVNICNWKLKSTPFETWGPRTIPDTELIFVHAGIFSLETNSGTFTAGEHELIIIHPGERHRFYSTRKTGTISCIHCDLPAEIHLSRVQRIADPEIPDAFRRCVQAFIHPSLRRDELLKTILTELLIRLSPDGTPKQPLQITERTAEMIRYIREHCDEPVTRDGLAEKFHISLQHINYLFKTETGISPISLLHLERAKKAFLLIQNERLSVKEAAERTGFYDAYHFSKVFKKVYGFPPGRVIRFFKPQ